ncbi:MAG: site-specific DNA-methyltransferase [Candidatus Dormibacteria bacterium]
MSRLNDLLFQLRSKEPEIAKELEREFAALADRRAFGLNFERHVPEAVELPGRKVRKGDKVRVLPPRGDPATKADDTLWRVVGMDRHAAIATLERSAGTASGQGESASLQAAIEDLVVVAEFRDPIYPGLVSTGKVVRGGNKPYHVVINAENYHALETLLFAHRGKIDAIYIDPPYNTGAKDWKYNNDYVEDDDLYRHSKWLAMMERRLTLAKELLRRDDSVLIVTIDLREVHRLALLIEQLFPESRQRMISTVINPKGVGVTEGFKRVDEYVLIVRFGQGKASPSSPRPLGSLPLDGAKSKPQDPSSPTRRSLDWQTARRRDLESARGTAKGGPAQFFPIYVNETTGHIEAVGEALTHDQDRSAAPRLEGCTAVFPVREDGTEMNWAVTAPTFISRWKKGYARAGKAQPGSPQPYIVQYLKSGPIADIESGRAIVEGRNADRSVIAYYEDADAKAPPTQWNLRSHNAEHYGTKLLKALVPGCEFDYPKSLYAVEDVLQLFLAERRDAIVLDFFAGSGTTAHAVMRLNRQDGGARRSVAITNNEVGAKEHAGLRAQGLRPGDPAWEARGICESVTKPRLRAAISGRTASGAVPEGAYRFTDEFPLAEGFSENIEFFTLTYEAPLRISSNREFTKIAPLLWMRAGARGRHIHDISGGWDVADTYGIIADLDQANGFLDAIRAADTEMRLVYIVTDEDRLFEAVAQQISGHIETVRLYESYLRNFEIESRRGLL